MSDSENSADELPEPPKARNQMPVIQAVPSSNSNGKARKKYVYKETTQKMRERNLAASRKAQENRKANKAKLAEYEVLKSMKTISKEDAEELLNSRFNALEERLKKLTEVPALPCSTKLNDIKEEPEDTAYLSSGSTDSQKRTSTRFSKREFSPSVSRLSERFKRF